MVTGTWSASITATSRTSRMVSDEHSQSTHGCRKPSCNGLSRARSKRCSRRPEVSRHNASKKVLDIEPLCCKVRRMETNWAAEHLQVIRTLMERSAIYRRALAPIMALTGTLGIIAALGGWLAGIDSPRAFVTYWLSVSLAAVVGALLLVRR